MSEEEEIQNLKSRHQELLEKKAIAGDRLNQARADLDEAKSEAREEFETDDPKELAKQLKALRADNQRKIEQFAKNLNKVETKLEEIETKRGEVTADD